MKKRYYAIALSVCIILLISSCQKSGASSGTAPKTPFIGGTGGLTINFEKDSPPPEVTDDNSFTFNAIIRLKNDGESPIDKNNVRLNLIGFDPADFGKQFDDLKDLVPDDDLQSKKRDAEGNIIEGNPTFVTFPRGRDPFIPRKFTGNTEFTFRSEVCYNYKTISFTKLCILKDMINVNDRSLCKPNGARTIYSRAAPVQINNFRQTVIGKNKLSFSFDVVLSGNVDIFWKKDTTVTPSSGFDEACPKAPRERRDVENNVGVELTEVSVDPIFSNLKCGGLNSNKDTIRLVNGRRTVVCTVDLVENRLDLEKGMGINLVYNVLDNKETKILIKHLADTSS